MIKLIYLLAEVWAIVVSIYAMRDKKVKLSINTVFFVFLEILYMLLVSYGIIIKETLIIVYVVFVAYVLLEFNEILLDAICIIYFNGDDCSDDFIFSWSFSFSNI